MRIRWLTLTTAALAVLACLSTYRLETSDSFARPDSTFTSLRLETRNGPIEVSAGADSTATVTVRRFAYGRDSAAAATGLANIIVSDTLAGSVWQVTADVPPGSRTSGAAINAVVRPKVPISVSTVNDDIRVYGLSAKISIDAANCSVTTAGTEGELSITTSNQKVTVQVHRGQVDVATTNAAVECDLAFVEPSSQNLLSTTAAKITLLLPADVSATIVANTTSGDILISGFHVTYDEHTPTRVRARIGSGAATITLGTTNGDIVIRPRS
ncbi:MAG: DUF4097 family beta strand repeat-containing protein [candidate division WOR-3 bacterium]